MACEPPHKTFGTDCIDSFHIDHLRTIQPGSECGNGCISRYLIAIGEIRKFLDLYTDCNFYYHPEYATDTKEKK